MQVTDVAKDSVEFEVFENSPPDFLERIPKIALAQFEEDSLNNRFYPLEEIMTDAVIAMGKVKL